MKSEFQFLESIRNKFNLSKTGDDCAVLPKDAETDLVITTDLLIEDVDFRLEWTKPEFVGHKALAVSLSDVAAMGAKPVWSMLSIGVPEKIWKTDFVERFYDGYFALAKEFNVELVGGDVSKTPKKIVIDSIVAGEIQKGKAVLRSTAKVGDSIFVTGKLGGATGGLKLLENGERFDKNNSNASFEKLILRQLKPTPQVKIGQFLAENNLATSMIDLSDGLSSDLHHICDASEVGAKIYAEKIPFNKNLREISSENLDFLDFALHGGEDFELLFTANEKKMKKFLQKKFGQFHHIGRITETIGKIELIGDGKSRILQPKGYVHF